MDKFAQSLDYVKSLIGDFKPEIGIVLGSGLGTIADDVKDPKVVPYGDIPGFPVPTAIGHKGNFVFGTINGRKVCVMQGRIHYYETCDMEQVVAPVRLAGCLGIKYLFVTNAGGSVNASYRIGDLMVINDHINLMPNPLCGPLCDKFGERFTDMSNAYDLRLISLAEAVAAHMGIRLYNGVYLATSGPSYETAAENRFFRIIGADAVGMSSTSEVIAARQMGVRVFGVSVITGLARDAAPGATTNGGEVLKEADRACRTLASLLEGMIKNL